LPSCGAPGWLGFSAGGLTRRLNSAREAGSCSESQGWERNSAFAPITFETAKDLVCTSVALDRVFSYFDDSYSEFYCTLLCN